MSNEFLPDEMALSKVQMTRLLSMGWRPPVWEGHNYIGNFFRGWHEIGEESLVQIAREILRVFTDVYGVWATEEVKVEFPG
ncbi:MAG: hypothetical protein DRH70_01795 [Candidatus Coatesbacteria bacterium]|nr:MAG: hypothetical protein DRH70_01795 [Candidatus Coatesbacteria bacterium]